MRKRIMHPYSKIHRRAALRSCGAFTYRAAASRRCFGGLGLRRRPLALSLVIAQRLKKMTLVSKDTCIRK
jgi:hypothetical protein